MDSGARTRLASRVSIPSGKRQHLDEQGGISHGETVFTQVRIGADCWLGEGAIVLDDIGEASIVAAGAVVGHAMPGGVLIGGNPAKVIRALPGPGDAAVSDGPAQARSETAASDGPVRDRADTVASDAPLHARADTSAPDAPAHARTASDADAEAVFEVPRTGGSA